MPATNFSRFFFCSSTQTKPKFSHIMILLTAFVVVVAAVEVATPATQSATQPCQSPGAAIAMHFSTPPKSTASDLPPNQTYYYCSDDRKVCAAVGNPDTRCVHSVYVNATSMNASLGFIVEPLSQRRWKASDFENLVKQLHWVSLNSTEASEPDECLELTRDYLACNFTTAFNGLNNVVFTSPSCPYAVRIAMVASGSGKRKLYERIEHLIPLLKASRGLYSGTTGALVDLMMHHAPSAQLQIAQPDTQVEARLTARVAAQTLFLGIQSPVARCRFHSKFAFPMITFDTEDCPKPQRTYQPTADLTFAVEVVYRMDSSVRNWIPDRDVDVLWLLTAYVSDIRRLNKVGLVPPDPHLGNLLVQRDRNGIDQFIWADLGTSSERKAKINSHGAPWFAKFKQALADIADKAMQARQKEVPRTFWASFRASALSDLSRQRNPTDQDVAKLERWLLAHLPTLPLNLSQQLHRERVLLTVYFDELSNKVERVIAKQAMQYEEHAKAIAQLEEQVRKLSAKSGPPDPDETELGVIDREEDLESG